jgi:hypothetical protein
MREVVLGLAAGIIGGILWGMFAHGADIGQIPPDVKPEIREWFKNLTSPGGTICCDVADGRLTDYSLRPDGYWVPIEGKMWRVPDVAVIKDSKNPFLVGVVWYRKDPSPGYDPHYTIRCFTPGGGS